MKYREAAAAAVLIGLLTMASSSARAETPDEFGKRLNGLLDAGKLSEASACWDMPGFIDLVTRNVAAPPGAQQGFAKGLGNLPMQLYGRLAQERGATGSYKYLHMVKRDGEDRPIFRFITDQGLLNYHELITVSDAQGSTKVRDLYVYITGETIGQTVRRQYTRVMLEQAKDIAADPSVKAFDDLNAARAANDHAKVLAIYDALPPKLKKEKAFSIIRVSSAMNVDDAAYERALVEHINMFGQDATVSLMSIDLHLLKKDYARAMANLDEVDKAVGGDPYLDVMRANVCAMSGEKDKVIPLAKRALEREPTLFPAADIILTDALERKDYVLSLELMLRIEREMNFRFGDYAAVPAFAEFARSPQNEQFLAQRPKQ